ncbi:GntR family transcriptional regulator [Microbacterium trichothecenolyticum]|uniref:GntR family transcriptional regulator n=1 Tax=Microbacterium trichothecenolyticum TaxID=69370 RepID=UPI001C6EC677|nr:GntR family transcriptional regulator [Microbacterium trichothecenolyticum]MBW9118804.1 GntR family transcriptional regulator [Microbacterium trichothecenolyticum]
MTSDIPLGLADQPLSAKIYELLRERIIEGVLRPGERIRERELAAELNVSRIPIREAMPRLEAEGFIKTLPRRGAVVTEMTMNDVEELFAVRSSLEVLAAKLAAQACAAGRSPDELFARLAEAEAALEGADDAAIAGANSALHEEILNLSSNSLLIGLMGPINGRVRRLFRLEAERDQRVLCAEHKELCHAIADGNAEWAGALAYAHVEHSRADSLRLIRERTQ